MTGMQWHGRRTRRTGILRTTLSWVNGRPRLSWGLGRGRLKWSRRRGLTWDNPGPGHIETGWFKGNKR